MQLSAEQRSVVAVDENTFVSACPGAGKTRVATAKVQREIGAAISSGREIICLTYTNAARDEITSRLERSLSSSWLSAVRIRTLHGFLLESVLGRWKFRSRSLPQDFELAVPGSPRHEHTLQSVLQQGGVEEASLRRSVQTYWRDVNGEVQVSENVQLVKRFVETLEGSGAIDYPGVLYHGDGLMHDEVVSRALRSAVSWLIVDEYQDFNPIALDIFSRLVDGQRTKAFLIGDLGQMIYAFNGVTLETLRATANLLCHDQRTLDETYRCGSRISTAATQLGLGNLQPTGKAQHLVDEAWAIQGNTADALARFMAEVCKRNLPHKEVAVLAPTNAQSSIAAKALTSLGTRAIVFTGHGKSGHGWLIDVAGSLFVGCRDFNKGALRLFQTKLYEAFDALGLSKQIYCRFDEDLWLTALYELRATIDLQRPFNRIAGTAIIKFFTTLSMGRMVSPLNLEMVKRSARAEWKRILKDSPHILNISGVDLAELVVPTDSVRCMTIHVAKGLEFAAVALVGCEEKILPYYNYYHAPDVEAGRRQFFVALTRGEELFVATLTDNRSRYLEEAGIQVFS